MILICWADERNTCVRPGRPEQVTYQNEQVLGACGRCPFRRSRGNLSAPIDVDTPGFLVLKRQEILLQTFGASNSCAIGVEPHADITCAALNKMACRIMIAVLFLHLVTRYQCLAGRVVDSAALRSVRTLIDDKVG